MKKPNIILIYPDEMRYDSTSYSGNEVCKTPAIDLIAKEGASFTSAYTSFPLCCPFRSSLMTGKYAHKSGVFCNHYKIPLNQEFLPEIMNKNGYQTAWFGKWHLSGDNMFEFVEKKYRLGFQNFVGYNRGHRYLGGIYYRNDDRTPHKSRKYEPEYQTDHLLSYISEASKEDKPFMAMLCYGLPHHPVEMQPDYYKTMYNKEDIDIPDTVPEWSVEQSKQYRAFYYGLVTCVDDQILRIDTYLKTNGLVNNTIFIIVSDHGDMCEEHGITDKNVGYKSSTHVPLFIRYPKLIKEGTVINQIVDPTVTLTPTILDLCNINIPLYMAGQSLKKVLTLGYDNSLNDYSYLQLLRTYPSVNKVLSPIDRKYYAQRGIRTKDYLYIELEGKPFMLYDLNKDPDEKYNCVGNFKYDSIVDKLSNKLHDIMKKEEDSWDIGLIEFPEHYASGIECEENYKRIYNIATYEKE